MNVSTAIICDQRRVKKDGQYPVKLRVTYRGKQKYYPLNATVSPERFERIMDPKAMAKNKQIQVKYTGEEVKARRIIEKMGWFSFYEFDKRYLGNTDKGSRRVYDRFTHYIEQLETENRLKTAISYKTARNSFEKFKENSELEDLTPTFLRDYEASLVKDGRSLTTVGINVRSLRTIYNIALDEGLVVKEQYPFGRRKYMIPTPRNVKKSLTLEEIKKLFDYKPEPFTFEDRSKDFWFFSYLCGGMNFKDIAYLKPQNIEGGFITFIREKTRLTSRSDQRPISIPLHPNALKVIEKWGDQLGKADDFIFPIIKKGDPLKKQIDNYGQFIQVTNGWMKKIAGEVKIEKKVTTSVARHSHATILKRSGASMEFISEQLGHSNLRTTENYLDSFDDEVKREFSSRLMNFSELEKE